MKHIIITGSSGLVATELTYALLKQTDAHLYLLSTHIENISKRYGQHKKRVSCFTIQTFSKFVNDARIKYDYCIHTAFSRNSSGKSIVESINYQRELIALLKKQDLGVFVNISSQSVYGKTSEPLWKEDTQLDPDYLYAMGKYFSEIVTQQMLEGSCIKWTNIRLCSVCEKARFVHVLVQNAIDGNPILLTAPDQQCSFIDVQDVASALMAFMGKAKNINLFPAYNLGANLVNTIGEVASMIKSIAEKKYGLKKVNIVEQESNNHVRIGMDATSFMTTFSWRPQRSMEDMVVEMFEALTNSDNGIYPISFKIVYKS